MLVHNRRQVLILNSLGLHMRAAQKFVQLARRYEGDVRVCGPEGRVADGKSILELMTLAAACGTTLEIEASGIDGEQMLHDLAGLIEAGFYETDEIE
jgi:phosphocarrier protein HPr